MGTLIDLTGKKFGRLTVIKRGENATNTYGRPVARWICLCDCGAETLVRGAKLTTGSTVSCGCFHDEGFAKIVTTHGKRRTRTYESWSGAKQRCYNPNDSKFHLYGALGVVMCDRWKNSFENFLADMGEAPAGKTIDRFPDRNGNYEPGNCRWATPLEQANNLRTTRYFEWRGETMTITQWAKRFGVSRDVIKLRLRRGHDFSAICESLNRA